MPVILIGGYYGGGNLGDDAILEAMLGELRAQQPGLSFIVTSWRPDLTANLFGVKAIHWQDVNALLDAGMQANMIILGGGGLFHDYWGFDPESYLRINYWDLSAFGSLPLLAKLLDIPCMIYAVGVGPLKSDLAIEHTRIAFQRSQVATVRDVESLSLLEKIHVNQEFASSPLLKVFPDPVFTLQTHPGDELQVAAFLSQRHIFPDVPLLCISLRYWDLSGPPWIWLPYIAEGINIFLEKNRQVQVILLPFQVQDASLFTNDVAILKKLYEYVAESWRFHLIENEVSPAFSQALIKRCSIMMGMRFHSMVLGINAGTPIVALSYSPKVESLMKAAGLEEFCNLTLTPNPAALSDQLQRALDERVALRVRLGAIHAKWNTEAKKHVTLALELLSTSSRKDLNFSQKFAIEQLRLLVKTDKLVEQQKMEIETLQSRGQQLDLLQQQLNEIQDSRFLIIARIYYSFAQYVRNNVRMVFDKAVNAARIVFKFGRENFIYSGPEGMQRVVDLLKRSSRKRLFVIVDGPPAGEPANSRAKALSKMLSMRGWGVVLVSSKESPDFSEQNVFWVSTEAFLEYYELLTNVNVDNKFFVLTYPTADLFAIAVRIKQINFQTVYDIACDWESLPRNECPADIYLSAENAIVNNVNIVTAASASLSEKFSVWRRDIQVVASWTNDFSKFMKFLESREWMSL